MKRTANKGFSLVELSVVITIISLSLGGALDLATKKTIADKRNETNEKMALIQNAFEHFIIHNQRLPCPADGTLGVNDDGFGEEADPGVSGCDNSNLFTDGSEVYAGIVPVKTLNLTDDTAIDGWNHRFTYVVDSRFTNSFNVNSNCNGTLSTYCFQHTTAGSITIRSDVAPAGGETASEAVYVLISHGKNGHGAFKRTGGTDNADRLNAASSDTSEQENAEYSAGGANLTYDATFIDKQQTTTYDDIVLYREKWHLVSDTNQVTGILCEAASDTTSTCTGANEPTTCTSLGTLIHNLCMQQ